MRVTRNFRRSEFERSQIAKRHGIDNRIPKNILVNLPTLACWLQTLRDRLSKHYGREVPITILSGYRAPRLNKKAKGSSRSAHLKCLGADIVAAGLTAADLFAFIRRYMKDTPFDQCILEFNTWVHLGLKEVPILNRNQLIYSYRRRALWGGSETIYTFV